MQRLTSMITLAALTPDEASKGRIGNAYLVAPVSTKAPLGARRFNSHA